MQIHQIDLNKFLSRGYVVSDVTDGELKMTTTFNTEFKRRDKDGNKLIGYKICGNEMRVSSYVFLPEKYSLPLQIDLTVKINAPMLHIMLGGGLISFGMTSGGSINIRDISGEPHDSRGERLFNHIIPFNEYFIVSMLFDFDCMQIKINDEIRYYSENEKYMKSKAFLGQNQEGLELKITCHKGSELFIKNCTVTEYQNDVPAHKKPAGNIIPYHYFVDKTDKPDFEFCIAELSNELQNEIRLTNDFILKLKPLSLKRKIEGTGSRFCRMTYISDYGFAYHIHTEKNMANHYMNWILYNTRREQAKYGGTRKRELTVETLQRLSETSPEFAERMYDNLTECTGCACGGNSKPCGLDGCVHCGHKTDWFCSTLIEYNGRKKATCHGKMEFTATSSDFADARKVIEIINDILPTV